jgi:hypothetical protein
MIEKMRKLVRSKESLPFRNDFSPSKTGPKKFLPKNSGQSFLNKGSDLISRCGGLRKDLRKKE